MNTTFLQLLKRNQKGSIALYILLAVIIIASVMIANGVFPTAPISPSLHPSENLTSDQLSVTPDQTQFDIVTVAPDPNETDNKKLQLLTIKGVPKPKPCTVDAAVYFIIDVSSSMNLNGKLTGLKSALQTFATSYPDSGIIALEELGTEAYLTIPLSTYSLVKPQFQSIATGLTIPLIGVGTSTRKAFQLAKDTLASPLYGKALFPTKPFDLIFISDGIPESDITIAQCTNRITGAINPACADRCAIDNIRHNTRCFANDQDPTGKTAIPVAEDLSKDIRDMGVRIFSISYPDTGNALFVSKQATMMTAIASPDSAETSGFDYFLAPDPAELSQIITKIYSKICI